MPVTKIITQPNSESINSNYRPIVIECEALSNSNTRGNFIPSIVHCDIYIDGFYYKSDTKTAFNNRPIS